MIPPVLLVLLLHSSSGEPLPLAPGSELPSNLDPNATAILLEFRKSLPAGYTLRPAFKQEFSQKHEKVVSRLMAVTPVDPDGRADGNELHYEGQNMVRTVPFVQGVKEGVEYRYDVSWEGGRHLQVATAEIPWKQGKIEGVKKLSYPTGQIRSETPHANGVPHGVAKEYDLPGKLVKSTPYENGMRHGEMVDYWPSTGKPSRIIPFKSDRIEGVIREFYDSGKLKKELPARGDRFHGVEKHYDEEGKLIKKRFWLDDQEVPEAEFRQGIPGAAY
ncbi:MAG: toxin-antitoxin system YwqK family antitoxin [Planctomycetes bacterium]|nr:toxin-antitoxin system YwqK family antitoxin [Planctomycetota bacterium]